MEDFKRARIFASAQEELRQSIGDVEIGNKAENALLFLLLNLGLCQFDRGEFGTSDSHFRHDGGDLQPDHGHDVRLIRAQRPRQRLGLETVGGDCELKRAGGRLAKENCPLLPDNTF